MSGPKGCTAKIDAIDPLQKSPALPTRSHRLMGCTTGRLPSSIGAVHLQSGTKGPGSRYRNGCRSTSSEEKVRDGRAYRQRCLRGSESLRPHSTSLAETHKSSKSCAAWVERSDKRSARP